MLKCRIFDSSSLCLSHMMIGVVSRDLEGKEQAEKGHEVEPDAGEEDFEDYVDPSGNPIVPRP